MGELKDIIHTVQSSIYKGIYTLEHNDGPNITITNTICTRSTLPCFADKVADIV